MADLLDRVLKLGTVHLLDTKGLLVPQGMPLFQDMALKSQKVEGTERHWSGKGQHLLGRV